MNAKFVHLHADNKYCLLQGNICQHLPIYLIYSFAGILAFCFKTSTVQAEGLEVAAI